MIQRGGKVEAGGFIAVDREACNGCLACLHACPTGAFRVRNGKARIRSDLCLGCGSCLTACPARALQPAGAAPREEKAFQVRAALPSPVLYTQFGARVMPNDVLLALKKIGFDHVFDQAAYCEWVSLALNRVLSEEDHEVPAISTICPGATRLVRIRYPSLIPHLVPITPPREVGARMIRKSLQARLGLEPEQIGLFHITPCPAKCVPEQSGFDGVMGIDAVYGPLLSALKSLTPADRETLLFRGGGFGIGWEMSGGEAEGMRHVENILSVCGLRETIDALEMIESGRMGGVRYVECRICEDGCLGGALNVAGRFQARDTLRRLVRMFGDAPRVHPEEIDSLIDQGFFRSLPDLSPIGETLSNKPLDAIRLRVEMERLLDRLPRRYCGTCGAPDCTAFAEDVVLGRADLHDCPFVLE